MSWLTCELRRLFQIGQGHAWDVGGRCRKCGAWRDDRGQWSRWRAAREAIARAVAAADEAAVPCDCEWCRSRAEEKPR